MDELPFTPELLRLAYAQGYFPMPHPDTGDIVWLSPNPRAVVPLDGFHRSRSLLKTLRKGGFEITFDKDFAGVIAACADREETWITDDFKAAYTGLHAEGAAHSVEVWRESQLVGGTYGVSLAGAFFAESMFHKETDASKVALVALVRQLQRWNFGMIDCQMNTPHLASLGAREIPRAEFTRRLQELIHYAPVPAPWHLEPGG